LLMKWKETLPTKVMQSFLLFLLQHIQTWSVVLTCLSKRREANFSSFSNSIIPTFKKLGTLHVPFSSVNYCMIYNY
jgi:hypothetical protein